MNVRKIMLSIRLVFLVIGLIAMLVLFCKLTYNIILNHKSIGKEVDIETNFSEMYETYRENEVLANNKYKNKVCAFDIIVEEVKEDTSGHPFVSIHADDYTAIVYFNKNQRETFLKIESGDVLKVKARCKGFGQLFSDIEFNQAEVLECD